MARHGALLWCSPSGESLEHEFDTRLVPRAGKAGQRHERAGRRSGACLAVFRRDLHVYMSYRTRMVSQLLTSVFSLTLFYYISRLVHVSGFAHPNEYFAFVVVGIASSASSTRASRSPKQVRQELVAGTFERLLLSPFGAVGGMVAMTLFPLLFSFVLAATTLGVGVVAVRAGAALVDRPAQRAGDGPGAARLHSLRAVLRRDHGRHQAGQRRHQLVHRPRLDRRRPLLSGCTAAGMGADPGRSAAVHPRDGTAAPPADGQPAGELDRGHGRQAGRLRDRARPRSRCWPCIEAIRYGQRRGTIIEY